MEILDSFPIRPKDFTIVNEFTLIASPPEISFPILGYKNPRLQAILRFVD
jgi:hypothetical protein